jgi:hypothetical protein
MREQTLARETTGCASQKKPKQFFAPLSLLPRLCEKRTFHAGDAKRKLKAQRTVFHCRLSFETTPKPDVSNLKKIALLPTSESSATFNP